MGESSGRKAAFNESAHSLATMERWIDHNTVYRELLQKEIANGCAAKDGESTAQRTIESGLEAGRLWTRAGERQRIFMESAPYFADCIEFNDKIPGVDGRSRMTTEWGPGGQ